MYTLQIYLRLTAAQIRSRMQERLGFWLGVVGTALITLTAFGGLAAATQRFNGLGGWTLAEVAFLYGFIEASFGMMDMFFSGFDPPAFGRLVRQGMLDQLLLKPVNITLQVLSSDFALRRIGRIFQGFFIFFAALAILQPEWSAFKTFYLLVVFFSTICFFGGLFISGATVTFWTVDSIEVVNILTYGGSEMMSYPMHIYQDWMRRFFTYILPAIFLNYYPTLFFLNKPDPLGMPAFAPFLSPLVGLGVLGAALAFWNFGLRYYQSTGS